MSDPSEGGRSTLTPRMRVTLVAVAAVVIAGAIGAGALWLAPDPDAPAADRAATSPSERPSSGPRPGATPVAGSEVQAPPTTSAPPRSAQLPAPVAPAPRIQAPLPASAAENGAIVPGYPTELAGPVEGSTVLDTSVSTADGVMQFALRARSDSSPEALRALFADQWQKAGLTGPGPDPAAPSFTDAFSSVTIAVEAVGTGSLYTIFGVLRAG